MQPSNWIPVFVRIVLPFLVMAFAQPIPIPKQLITSFQISHLAKEGNRPDKAAESLRDILLYEAWRSELWEQIGLLEQSYGNWEAAVQAFQFALKRNEISVEALFALGEVYFQLEQHDNALAIWQGLVGSSVKNEALFRKVFELQGELDRKEDQVKTLQAWQKYQPENPEVLYYLGLFTSFGDIDQSIEYLKEAKRFDPSYAVKVDALIVPFELIDPDQIESHRILEIGRILAGRGHWKFALDAFTAAVKLDPGYAEAWAFLGEANQQLGRGGADALEKANSLSPNSVVVKALTAIHFRRQNQPEKAIETLERILELEPEEGVWKVELGYAVAQTGDIHRALNLFLDVIDASPENPVFLSELIRFCIRYDTEIRTIALPAARAYLLLENENSQSLDMMGLVMMVLEDNISALRYLKRAVEEDPMNASAHLNLGQLYLSQQEMDQAFVHLSLASQMVHTTPQVSETANRLLELYFPDRIQ